jgi:hypothetical protein
MAALALLSMPVCADSLQTTGEGRVASCIGFEGINAVLDGLIQDGLAFPPGQDLAAYLGGTHAAYLRLPAAWELYVGASSKPGAKVAALRAEFLRRIGLPLSAAHLALARQQLQTRKSGLGYGLDLPDSFHADLDQAIVFKNATDLHAFFFAHLAHADLSSEAQDPAATYRNLLTAMAREVSGYSVQDFKDIFCFQAPGASADYIDEEIFSLFRTLEEQKALTEPVLRLVDEVATTAGLSLVERHRRMQRVFGELAFGPPPEGQGKREPLPASLAKLKTAVSGWALRQGRMRTLLFGEHLAYEYAQCLRGSDSRKRLQALQGPLQLEVKAPVAP